MDREERIVELNYRINKVKGNYFDFIELHTEDRQPVVRCKDCKHFVNNDHCGNTCTFLCIMDIDPNWFCAEGERETERFMKGTEYE